jgi:hypothetical protein
MRLKHEHEQRLEALRAFVANYEAERGVISDDEIETAVRSARSRAFVIRPLRPAASRGGRRHRS